MRRHRIPALMAIAVLAVGLALAPGVGAARPSDRDPHSIDPSGLALPLSALPPGATVLHSGVSDNADADGTTTPADGHLAYLHLLHPTPYSGSLGRRTGYRMDVQFPLGGTTVDAEYLASIYPSAAAANASLADVLSPGSTLSTLGQPLPAACTLGDTCRAYAGSLAAIGEAAVYAIDVHGPITLEIALLVSADLFSSQGGPLETSLLGLLTAGDALIPPVLQPLPAATPTATASQTATATATPHVAAPVTRTPASPSRKHCKKGYKLVKGKCRKKK